MQGLKPFVIPVGGSSPLGTWGYLEAALEMEAQLKIDGITDVVLVHPLANKSRIGSRD